MNNFISPEDAQSLIQSHKTHQKQQAYNTLDQLINEQNKYAIRIYEDIVNASNKGFNFCILSYVESDDINLINNIAVFLKDIGYDVNMIPENKGFKRLAQICISWRV